VAISINMGFLVEFILHFVAFEARWVLGQKTVLYIEIFCQLLNIISIVYFLSDEFSETLEGVKFVCIIFFIRSFRVVTLLSELENFEVIFNTFHRFTTPFATMCLTMYTVFFVYANIGMLLWSAKITTVSKQVNYSTPPLYYLMNFNDFGASLVTLFHIMVVNNWFITCDMYCYVMGNNWPRLFFISFWTMTVLIMLNLVIAFVIELYESASQITVDEFKRREYVI
jgi:two pore calcium channel protein